MKHAWLAMMPLILAAAGAAADRPGPSPARTHDVPLFDGLGAHERKVTTRSGEAQRYCDQGLALLYAFNHDGAIRSFEKAAELDPECPMAWWGLAAANGPHINNPTVPPERERAAWNAVRRARALAAEATETERALIEALGARHADPQPEDRRPLDAAYAESMRRVWRRFPVDADVGSLFAESLMDLRPWDLWIQDGRPQPGTEEIVATLEAVLAKRPDHPLALHLYIHAVEASPSPERADAAADGLRDLQPGLGHLVHMPSHIDVRRGRWVQAIRANTKAMEADRRYRDLVPRRGFYRLYMAHNHHMRAYAAMMIGRSAEATRTMDAMVAGIPEDWAIEFAGIADGFMAMHLEVRVRFGRWDEILAAPAPPERFPLARALRRYARGVALAATGDMTAARAERKAFLAAKGEVPPGASFGNNAAASLLVVAEELLEGEILYREGRTEAGIAALRRACAAEDRLRYDEPPAWIHPVRHALGAALLQVGRPEEAEQAYRENLRKLPDNGWSLFGLARSLKLQGKHVEAAEVEARFTSVWAGADVSLTSSCFCQPGAS